MGEVLSRHEDPFRRFAYVAAQLRLRRVWGLDFGVDQVRAAATRDEPYGPKGGAREDEVFELAHRTRDRRVVQGNGELKRDFAFVGSRSSSISSNEEGGTPCSR
jgi:hypothetical protein